MGFARVRYAGLAKIALLVTQAARSKAVLRNCSRLGKGALRRFGWFAEFRLAVRGWTPANA